MFYERDPFDDEDDGEVYIGDDDDEALDDDDIGEAADDFDDIIDDEIENHNLYVLEYYDTFENAAESDLARKWYREDPSAIELLDLSEIIKPLTVDMLTAGRAEAGHERPPGDETAAVSAAPPPVAPTNRPPLLDGEVLLKESAAVRFMKARKAVLFPVDDQMNRKKLQEWFLGDAALSQLVSGAESLWVGYKQKAPAFLAVALVSDPDLQASLLELLPGAWLSSAKDTELRPFMREERLKQRTEAEMRVFSLPKPPKPKKWVAGRDLDLLHWLVTHAGGIDRVRFATVDVEAAVVLPGAIALPLEFAVFSGDRGLIFHEFVHPGYIQDDRTASRLSTCNVRGGHGIPYKNASFLRVDYDQMSTELFDKVIRDPATILINRGSQMDVNCFRWTFAAAHALRGEIAELPAVNIFEIEALGDYLGVPFDEVLAGQTAASATGTEADASCEDRVPGSPGCWYHDDDAVVARFGKDVHCAVHDAFLLHQRLALMLSMFEQRTPDGIPAFVRSGRHSADAAASPSQPSC